MLCLDADGWITGANPVARQMVPGLQASERVHASDVFGLPVHLLFDAARRNLNTLEVPLWSGLRLSAMAVGAQRKNLPAHYDSTAQSAGQVGLKDMETALIHKAMEQARGNVAQAAQALGISRATVYRKLGRKARP
jgi:DNA-binding NtrC family response regulator